MLYNNMMPKKKKIPVAIKQKILKMLLNKSAINYQRSIDTADMEDLENQLKQINNG